MGIVEIDVWGEDVQGEKAPSEVTVKELQDICESMYRLQEEITDLKEQKRAKEEEFLKLERKVLESLEAHNMTSFETTAGKVVRQARVSVKQPADIEKKKELFEYLRSKGIFEELVSVNSNTLSAWAKKEYATAEEAQDFSFKIPGLEPPQRYYYLALRKK